MSHGHEPTGRNYLRQLLGRREDIAVHPSDALDRDAPPEDLYFHRPGELLVSSDPEQVELFERVATELGLEYCNCGHSSRPRLRGKSPDLVAAAPLPGASSTTGATRFFVRSQSPLEVILRRLERASHRKLNVTANHVLLGCPVWTGEPHGDPSLPPTGALPALAGGGAGVTVAVVDSGVPEHYDQNFVLSPIVTSASEEEPWPYSGRSPVLAYPDGHGSFVAGVVRQAAADATVQSYRAIGTDGVTDEWYLGHQLALVLAAGARVVNLSLGTSTRSDEPLMGLTALAAAASQGTGAPIVVAAAGNLGDSRPFYPAADDWAIGVGAVQLTGAAGSPVPAAFSDYGPWVDVCALGVDVLSSYEDKPYQTQSDPRTIVNFQGFALWSGTSFATPHVSGVVAQLLEADPGLDRAGVLAGLRALTGAVPVPNLGWYVP